MKILISNYMSSGWHEVLHSVPSILHYSTLKEGFVGNLIINIDNVELHPFEHVRLFHHILSVHLSIKLHHSCQTSSTRLIISRFFFFSISQSLGFSFFTFLSILSIRFIIKLI